VVRPQKFLANLVILAERLRTAAALGELFRPSDHRLILLISFDTSSPLQLQRAILPARR